MIKAMICFVAWLTNGSEIVLFTAKATSGSFTTSNADAVRGGIKPETKMISWDTYTILCANHSERRDFIWCLPRVFEF